MRRELGPREDVVERAGRERLIEPSDPEASADIGVVDHHREDPRDRLRRGKDGERGERAAEK
jgi:hypothetical protein